MPHCIQTDRFFLSNLAQWGVFLVVLSTNAVQVFSHQDSCLTSKYVTEYLQTAIQIFIFKLKGFNIMALVLTCFKGTKIAVILPFSLLCLSPHVYRLFLAFFL